MWDSSDFFSDKGDGVSWNVWNFQKKEERRVSHFMCHQSAKELEEAFSKNLRPHFLGMNDEGHLLNGELKNFVGELILNLTDGD